MAADTYTVKQDDTLWGIANRLYKEYGYASHYDFQKFLIEANNIVDPDFIVTGQTLKMSTNAGGSDNETPPSAGKPTINVFGVQTNTDRTMYVTWSWSKDNTKEYHVVWYYATGDGIWFIGNDSTIATKAGIDVKQNLYTAPSNATKVKFKVLPKSETKTVNKKETTYWTAEWSTAVTYNFNDIATKPPVPTVEIKDFTLTATLDNLNINGDKIEFQVVKNNSTVFKTGSASNTIKINKGHVTFSCTVEAGGEYKVRCRAVKDDSYSDWSEYSANQGTVPAASSGITKLRALSETSVYIEWSSVKNATGYEIEYTTNKDYFDSSSEPKSASSTVNHAELIGLTSGQEYFFRVRAINDRGNSAWTKTIKSLVIGSEPAPPTTWSSTTTAIVGEPLTLYWVHNTEDGSVQTYAELEIYINGKSTTYTIAAPEDEESGDTSSYSINTASYAEGTTIQWRVRTAGITKSYGEWSTQRTIDIYAPPVLALSVFDSAGANIGTLTQFPFYISGVAGPNTQAPIGYHVSVIANESYETVDALGNAKLVSKGELIYSKHFDTSNPLMVEMSANNLDLENNVEYTISCTVSMNSGLSAESTTVFDVAWTDYMYEPNAEISVDMESYTTSIMPYCADSKGNLIEGVTLSVYRREFDGTFVELASGLDNTGVTFITDPHPALDYARYRIVATTTSTGAVSYSNLPGIPIGAVEAVLQWNEEWSSYNTLNEDALAEHNWTGSMLKLPYNLDVSDSNSPDVAIIEYIGRQHGVSYYGTQLGMSSTWNVDIEKDDEETLYALRRLQVWMGDVYVREPSGSGYWANVKVSFNQTHGELTIPVSLSITRVSGGV